MRRAIVWRRARARCVLLPCAGPLPFAVLVLAALVISWEWGRLVRERRLRPRLNSSPPSRSGRGHRACRRRLAASLLRRWRSPPSSCCRSTWPATLSALGSSMSGCPPVLVWLRAISLWFQRRAVSSRGRLVVRHRRLCRRAASAAPSCGRASRPTRHGPVLIGACAPALPQPFSPVLGRRPAPGGLSSSAWPGAHRAGRRPVRNRGSSAYSASRTPAI